MDRKKLDAAVTEAKRFLGKVKELPDPVWQESAGFTKGGYFDDNFPKQSGAIRRASMDLTRALADLRRPS